MGTVTPPAIQIAKSESIHSKLVPAMIATRSPGARPQAMRPAATSVTWVASCACVTGTQAPSTRRE